MKHLEGQAAQALRSIARNQHIKTFISQSSELYPLVLNAAKRFVTGEKKQEGIEVAKDLILKGYSISLEYIGENTVDSKECANVTGEFLSLIEEMGSISMNQTVSLDLSHIGLSVNPDIAYHHLLEIAKKATKYGITVMVSMEESSKTEDILNLYKKTTEQYENVGITLQAHLHRSDQDLQELLHYPGKIRVVKGAYQESSEVALARSNELNHRYLHLVEQVIEAKHPLSIATHDETLIQEMIHREFFSHSGIEIEMLYGVRPELLKDIKSKGHRCKVYLTYGQEWYLYLCHRIAENPENLYRAVIDMIDSSLIKESAFY